MKYKFIEDNRSSFPVKKSAMCFIFLGAAITVDTKRHYQTEGHRMKLSRIVSESCFTNIKGWLAAQ